MSHTWLAAIVIVSAVAGCTSAPEPARLVLHDTVCSQCGRSMANPRLAAQLAFPGDVPLFFDDIQCLADYLPKHTVLPSRATAFVTDHRTGDWTLAVDAVYTRSLTVKTPAGSQLLAHASAASRDEDPAARGGVPMATRHLFPLGVPDGNR